MEKQPEGRPMDSRRKFYIDKFQLKEPLNMRRLLTNVFMDQLDLCKSDEARRLLLGVREHEER